MKGEAFDALGKAGVDDPSPGWPKGTPNGRGGKFRPYKNTTPGIGHNGGPPREDAIKGKVSAKIRSAAVKTVGRARP